MKLLAAYVGGDESNPANGILIIPGIVITKDNVDQFQADFQAKLEVLARDNAPQPAAPAAEMAHRAHIIAASRSSSCGRASHPAVARRQVLSRRRGALRPQPRDLPRRSDRHRRRERCGQVDADEDPGRRRQADGGTIEIGGAPRDGFTVAKSMATALPSSTRNSTSSTISMSRPMSISGASRANTVCCKSSTRRSFGPWCGPGSSSSAPTCRNALRIRPVAGPARQAVEIVKALTLNSRLLILDEPTSSLALAETRKLLGIVSSLRDRGIAVIFISHRLGEVTAVADRVIVLRDGRQVSELKKHQISHDEMVKYMVGRELRTRYNPPAAAAGETAIAIRGLRTALHPSARVDLDIRKGG